MGELITLLAAYFSTKHGNVAGWALDGEWRIGLSFFLLVLCRAQTVGKYTRALQCFPQDGTGTCQMAMPPLIFWRGRRIKPDSRVNGFLSRAAGLRAVQGNRCLMSPHHRGTDAVVRWAGAREQKQMSWVLHSSFEPVILQVWEFSNVHVYP